MDQLYGPLYYRLIFGHGRPAGRRSAQTLVTQLLAGVGELQTYRIDMTATTEMNRRAPALAGHGRPRRDVRTRGREPVLRAAAARPDREGAFHVGQGAATVVVTMTQIGYALGLVFVLPLGDLFENRRLITRVLFATALALVLDGRLAGVRRVPRGVGAGRA